MRLTKARRKELGGTAVGKATRRHAPKLNARQAREDRATQTAPQPFGWLGRQQRARD